MPDFFVNPARDDPRCFDAKHQGRLWRNVRDANGKFRWEPRPDELLPLSASDLQVDGEQQPGAAKADEKAHPRKASTQRQRKPW